MVALEDTGLLAADSVEGVDQLGEGHGVPESVVVWLLGWHLLRRLVLGLVILITFGT